MPSSNPSSSPVDASFGALVNQRRYTATSYYLGGAFIALSPPIMVGSVIFGSKPTQAPDYTIGQKLLTVFLALLVGVGASLLLFIKGRRLSGMTLEIYESGMRFSYRDGSSAAFHYGEVEQVRGRSQSSGALISLTFVLADGSSHTATVHRPQDARMLSAVLKCVGPVEWARENVLRDLPV